ncbi:hypothetical protein BDP27DRAFT_1313934 [Rhodocollybia butyracea]|uniref:WW domain-containing protein n=1 Tax=Rhodocollybia butyracea TaxID=206335 RepID=A0A9P5UDD3_9AGAR|nr:hypothetical protein BDP27DRAFT_1313934 [Rhodocollybia butyracea]
MSSDYDDHPLPYGWIKQYHEGHPFYVDTKATPPRSIWTHPFEDEQYLHEHPDAREKARPKSSQGFRNNSSSLNPPVTDDRNRRHSFNGQSQSKDSKHKRGFFGKMKDKAIGTKEEREAEKLRSAQLHEQRRQQRLELQRAQQEAYAQQQAFYASQARYAPPPQQYGYGGGYGNGMGGFGGNQRMGGGGMGGGGMALPLLGGLAGGLLLGDVLDGGFDNGGGFF